MISGFHHVKLPVSDVRRSRDWYVEVLGFEPMIDFVEDGELRGVALQRNACAIALRLDPARAKALSGFDAAALLVPTPEQVHGWAAALDRRGEPHGGVIPGHGGGTVLVGLHDPDGIEIRLYADPWSSPHHPHDDETARTP